MKFRLFSDIHLEFGEFVAPEIDDEQDTVLLLAGDIAPIRRKAVYFDWIYDITQRHKKVLWTPGNHEYYGGSYDNAWEKLHRYMKEDVFEDPEYMSYLRLMNQDVIDLGDVVVVGATLWTDFDQQNPMTMQRAGMYMNDYKVVRGGNAHNDPYKGTLQPSTVLKEHMQAKFYIFEMCRKWKAEGKKVVVMTHHAPSRLSIHEKYKNDDLNGCYASEFGYELLELSDQGLAPDVWVHGHVHNSFDYEVGATRVIANPRGYVKATGYRPENLEFDPTLTFEL